MPKEEGPTLRRPNGILNKFDPVSIYDEISWCEQIFQSKRTVLEHDIEKFMFICNDNYLIDMHLRCFVPVSRERALQRRQEVYDVFSHIFSSQVVIITLGLIEIWFDTRNSTFLSRVPTDQMKLNHNRFQFIRLNYDQCYRYIQQSIDLINKHNHNCKFIITTSPVPLRRTFSNEDIIIANTYSKSVLRAVCGELVANNRLVDYFPSYEYATLTKNKFVYKDDLRQIKDSFVDGVIKKLAEYYF